MLRIHAERGGEVAFILAHMAHASFNVGISATRNVAVTDPCAGPIGCELVDGTAETGSSS